MTAGTLFRPASQCSAACVARSADAADQLHQLVRATLATLVVASAAVLGVLIGALPRSWQARVAPRLLRGTARRLLRVLGIRVTHTGAALPTGRALVVANHISWLDIIAMLATADVRLLAKAEVGTWPIIGRLARLSGAIFIDRDRPRRLTGTITEIRDALVAGDVVAAFPEGTTSCGHHGVSYRPAVFQAAIDAGVRVVPLAFRYRTPDGALTPQPAFIGDETLITSLRRVIRMPSLTVDVRVSASVYPQPDASRRALVRIVQWSIPITQRDFERVSS
jgi:1-acyl-sn-glycerol-3-phosphate acyltransferase